MSPESAEMTKYVANALLSTKISFINEMANICERAGPTSTRSAAASATTAASASPSLPRRGLRRQLLSQGRAGPAAVARAHGVAAADPRRRREVNVAKNGPVRQDREHFRRQLAGRTVAVWGLAFKPGTDDIREAPALVLIDQLLAGAQSAGLRPEAIHNVRRPGRFQSSSMAPIATKWRRGRCPGDRDRMEALHQPGFRQVAGR